MKNVCIYMVQLRKQKNFGIKLVTLKNYNVRNLKKKSVKVERKLNNMEQVIHIVKVNDFNLLK